MLPDIPSNVLWVVGLVVWLWVTFQITYMVMIRVIIIRSDESGNIHLDSRYFYLIALFWHLVYLVGYLYLTDYTFDLSVTQLGLIAFVGGISYFVVKLEIYNSLADVSPSRLKSRTHILYWLPVLPIAVIEELFYRGVLFEVHTAYGPGWFIAASALIFGVAHVTRGLHECVEKVFDGVIYAVTMAATGTVVVPVLLHLGYNFTFLLSVTRLGNRYR